MLFHAVSSCYNLTYPLSIILALGAYLLVGFWPLTLSGWTKITLHDICRKMGPSFHDRSDGMSLCLPLRHTYAHPYLQPKGSFFDT